MGFDTSEPMVNANHDSSNWPQMIIFNQGVFSKTNKVAYKCYGDSIKSLFKVNFWIGFNQKKLWCCVRGKMKSISPSLERRPKLLLFSLICLDQPELEMVETSSALQSPGIWNTKEDSRVKWILLSWINCLEKITFTNRSSKPISLKDIVLFISSAMLFYHVKLLRMTL